MQLLFQRRDALIRAADLRASRLVRLLPGWSLPQGGVHAVYPNARYTSPKVRTFLDCFRDTLTQR